MSVRQLSREQGTCDGIMMKHLFWSQIGPIGEVHFFNLAPRNQTHKADILEDLLRAQLNEEHLGIFQVDAVKTFRKPSIDIGQEITSFMYSPLVAP